MAYILVCIVQLLVQDLPVPHSLAAFGAISSASGSPALNENALMLPTLCVLKEPDVLHHSFRTFASERASFQRWLSTCIHMVRCIVVRELPA